MTESEKSVVQWRTFGVDWVTCDHGETIEECKAEHAKDYLHGTDNAEFQRIEWRYHYDGD